MASKKNIYSCDLETTIDPNDCRVWAYGRMEIYNEQNYEIGNDFNKFMDWVVSSDSFIYFHNLKFDGEFIISWLFNNGYEFSKTGEPQTFKTTISKMNQWYMIEIYGDMKGKRQLKTTIYDSYKKIPFKVEKIARDYKIDRLKGDIDHTIHRPIGHKITDEEYKYIYGDIYIVAQALKKQFDQGLTKMTTGSDALSDFRNILGGRKNFERVYPIFSETLNTNIRMAYRGGFTWLNKKFKNKQLGEGIVFDVNSLYPYVMYDRPLPYGQPIIYEGKYEYDEQYPLYIQHLRCSFYIKKDKIPTIQIKYLKDLFPATEYLENSKHEIVDLYLSSTDLELFFEHYDVYDLEYFEGWKFKSKTGLFKKYIDKWTYVKITTEGAEQANAKLMLNSLYGKFATNTDVTGKIPIMQDSGIIKMVEGEKETRDPIYTPLGVFITSYAREVTIRTAQANYERIIYCDTDSVHLVGKEIPENMLDKIDDKKLGFWSYEGTFKRAKYIRAKSYIQEIYVKRVGDKLKECLPDEAETIKLSVTCAGMTDQIKDKMKFEDFEIGFSSYGKLRPKRVVGGVVLEDSKFTIMERGFIGW